MSAAFWVYVRRPGSGFVKLSRKAFDHFYFRDGRLDVSLADGERYIETAHLLVKLHDGVPVRVLRAHFHRYRLRPDGGRDPEHHDLEMVWAMSKADAGRESSLRPAKEERGFPGLVEASSRFRQKRLDALFEWKPTSTEVDALGALLGARMDRKASSRERQVRDLLAMSVEERRNAAENHRTSAWKLERLADDPEAVVRAAVAANSHAPGEILERLRRDPADEVVSAVAASIAADESWLGAWTTDSRESVRRAVAANPRTPSFLVERMAWADRSEAVRAAAQAEVDRGLGWALRAAASEYASEASLLHAARDRRVEVRVAAAENPRSSVEVLALLADDVDPRVRDVVARRAGVEDSRSLVRQKEGPEPPDPPKRARQRTFPGFRRK